jgi:co-chaperonin GroES (HSP10)
MSDYIAPVLKPVNRHLTIIPHPQSEKTSSGVILPDDFKPEEDRYISATVIDIAEDCSPALRQLRGSSTNSKTIIVERSMVEEITLNDKSYYTVLENYVVGIMRGINEG